MKSGSTKAALVAAILATTIAAPAAAQQRPGTSVYGGVIAGYDKVRVSADGASESEGGILYGALAGVQFGDGETAVFGVEAEFSKSESSATATDVFEPDDRGTISAGRDLFLGARVGYQMAPTILGYFKGGYTNASAKLRYTDSIGTFEESDSLSGYRIGAGIELGQGRFRFRGEYRFSDYGEYKYNGIATGLDAQRHQAVVGVIALF